MERGEFKMFRDTFGCPPEYNPGFCYEPDEDECTRCWREWCKENGHEVSQALKITGAFVNSLPRDVFTFVRPECQEFRRGDAE